MTTEYVIFLLMVFLAVFFLARAIIIPTVSNDAKATRRIRSRISTVIQNIDEEAASILRERYLRNLTGLERYLESMPGMVMLSSVIEQAGRRITAYKFILYSLIFALIGTGLVYIVSSNVLFTAIIAPFLLILPFLKLKHERDKRIALFEQQLPDALIIIARAIRAGHPFNESLGMVGEELDDPIGTEFSLTYSDINYGMSVKNALLSLLKRIPSLSLVTVITAVVVQRDTGGNLAEILDNIAAMVRGRFKFQRKVRTLSAEARMSAWILTLIPFVLAAVLSFLQPDYLPTLAKDPTGRKIILFAFLGILVGTLWMRRIIRIEV